MHGIYFVSQNTGEDLQNSNPQTGQFITKETWLRFRSNYEWIETGTVYGAVSRSFNNRTPDIWRGAFVAINGCRDLNQTYCSSYYTGYREGQVGAQTWTGQHNFIIRKKTDGSEDYQVYIDYNPITVISSSMFTDPEPIGADIGIESSDTGNSFTSGTVADDFWIVDPNNENNLGTAGWYPVPSGIGNVIVDNNYNGASLRGRNNQTV